ncbi:DUF2273 domain-containing protein [Paenibacillus sp. IB182496]|uniref:DUF2273 domain-containing protein n=1 Tax=Paenibacillus sabuli TaxID=2772509 RepID=A0A927BWQ3_9BACL|nr:DUF2273 domain-containing protein [Paenibacillus sabuli]MBD2847296.1 DUF2273 domain-containing protein [Paenibacillus sabuli]
MNWLEIWQTHSGRIAGVACALLLGVVYLFFGFWDMLFFALLLWIGYYFGRQRDMQAPPLIPWQRVLDWMNDRWRPFR